jgi:hypothetical protein
MAIKEFLLDLARAGGKAVSGVGAAATEVLRDVEIPDTADENRRGPVAEFYYNSPKGDGDYMHVPDGVERASR